MDILVKIYDDYVLTVDKVLEYAEAMELAEEALHEGRWVVMKVYWPDGEEEKSN